MRINNHDWSVAYKIEANFRYIISEQESYGWFMDKDKLDELEGDLEKKLMRLYNDIQKLSPKKVTNEKELKRPLKKDGTPSSSLLNWYNGLDIRLFRVEDVVGSFTRIKIENINPESPKQRIEALQKVGWKPTEWNYKVDKFKKPIYDPDTHAKIPLSPKLTEDSVVGIPLGEAMVKYVQVSHRLKMVKGLKERIREDGSIGGGGNTVGAATGRMMHRNIVNIPSIKDGAFYAEEIRSCFSHRPGYILMGADLESLENRLAGHFTWDIDGGVYAKRIMDEDTHEQTVELFKRNGVTRDRSVVKNVNYALLYGATYHKIGEMLKCTDSEAKKLHKAWWEDRGALKILKEKVTECAEIRDPMWIKGIDGRKVYCRSKHSLLNFLIQSAGSIVNKFITCCVYKKMQEHSILGNFILNYHDEIDLEIKNDKKELDKMKQIIYNSIEECNKYFKFKIPMKMTIKVGGSWSDIH